MEKGTENDAFDMSEAAEDDELAELTNPVTQTTRRRVARHNTDIQFTSKRKLTEDVIIEDDYPSDGGQTPVIHKPPKKKTSGKVLVARHNTDVLRKRPPSRTLLTPSREIDEVQVTRRSVSRQGSRIQQGSRMQLADEEGTSSNLKDVLKSNVQNKTARKEMKILIKHAYRQIKQHKEQVRKQKTKTNTKALHHALQVVEKHGIALLTGKPGIGKTFTALNVVDALLGNNEDFRPVFVKSPFEIETLYDASAPLILFADDFLGAYGFDDSRLYGWNRFAKHLKQLVNGKRMYLILTAESECVVKITEKFTPLLSLIDSDWLVNLESDDCSLTREERKALLSANLKAQQKSLTTEEIETLTEREDDVLGFPLVSQFCNISDPLVMTEEPYKNLCTAISEMRTQSFPCYFVLILTLVFDGKFSLSGPSEDQSHVFDKLVDVFEPQTCSFDDLTSAKDDLNDMFITIDSSSSRCFRFSHNVVHTAVFQDFVRNNSISAIELLPIDVVSSINCVVSPDTEPVDEYNLNTSTRLNMNISRKQFKILTTRFKAALGQRKTNTFMQVASSRLWKNDSFSEIALAIFGTQFFFQEDKISVPFTAYFAKTGNIEILIKLANFIYNYREDEIGKFRTQILKTINEACREGYGDAITSLLDLLPTLDDSVVCAAAEGGNLLSLEILVEHGGQIFQRRSEALQVACKCSHLDVVKYICNQTDTDTQYSLIHKKDIEGHAIAHFAAMGANPETLEFILQQNADANVQTKDGRTILHVASSHGHMDMVRHISNKYPEFVQMTDNNGFTNAHFSAREGHLEALQFFVNLKVDPTLKVHGGNTIIHLAAYNGRTNILRYLCKHYPNLLSLPNNQSFTAVQSAATAGQVGSIQALFDIKVDPSIRTIDGRTLLHLAAFNGKVELVEYLCKRFPDMANLTDNDGNTAAHDASASGKIHVLQYLTKHYIHPLSISFDGCTVLHDACYYGRLDMVKYLSLNHPKLLNTGTQSGYAPCHGAALGGYINILILLIDKGADPYALSEDGCTILHEASFSGQKEMVRYILSKYPDLKTKANKRSYTPIHFAAQEGHLDICKLMLQDISDSDDLPVTEERQTVLHIAAYNGRLDVAKYLCQNFSSMVSVIDENGASAIHYASRGGHIELLSYLLRLGADPHATTGSGSTMLHLSAYDGQYDMLTHLCKKYPELLHELDLTGHNAAHYAAGSGDIKLLKCLIDQGVNPLMQTKNGSTMLLKAAFNGKLAMVKHLSENYPDIVALTDEFGCNVAHYAVCGGHVETLVYVIGLKVDPLTLTNDGHNLLHIAAYHGQLPIVQYLCRSYPEMRHQPDGTGLKPVDFAKVGEQFEVIKYLRVHAGNHAEDETSGSQTYMSRMKECTCCKDVFQLKTWRECCTLDKIRSCPRNICRILVSCACFCRRKSTDTDIERDE